MTSGFTSRSARAIPPLELLRRFLGALAISGMLVGEAEAASLAAVEAEHGMVVSAQHYASEVGAGILAEGGNAIDAAVAVGYALAVVDPCCGNIGGGGFMTIHLKDGRETFINFRETAPAAATAAMYLDASGQPINELSRSGYRAAGVPGTVMGLERARKEYGRLARRALLAPAIALARYGYVLGQGDTDILDGKRFAKDPVAAKIFLRTDGRRFAPGDRLVQTELAATLEAIAQQGHRRLLQRPDRGDGRAGEQREWRHPDRAGFCRLCGGRDAATELLLPRLPYRLGAAAELGRHDDMRNPQYSRRLRFAGARFSFGAIGAPAGRGDAPRLSRPQYLPRRPGVCAEPAGAPLVNGLRRATSARRSMPAAQHPPQHSNCRRKRPRRRIIRWSMVKATRSR